MDTSQLVENPLAGLCMFLAKAGHERSDGELENVIKAEAVVIDGKTWYNPCRAYCQLGRDRPEDFHERCPDPNKCPYSNGQAKEVKPKYAE